MKREQVTKIFKDAMDEQINAILDINSSDIGKAKGDFDTQKTQLDEAQKTIKSYATQIEELKPTLANGECFKEKFEKLQKKIEDEKAEAERVRKEQEAETELTNRFNALLDDKTKFVNELTKDGIYRQFKDAIANAENKGQGDKEIYEMLTKDKEGIFANPNPPADMLGMGDVNTKEIDDNAARAIMGLSINK